MYTLTGSPRRSPSSSRNTSNFRLPNATRPSAAQTVMPCSRCTRGTGASNATLSASSRMSFSSGPTVELTRRRDSKHPSPHQVSYETRSRRSRPTICWATPLELRAVWHGVVDATSATIKETFCDHSFSPSMLVGTFVGRECVATRANHLCTKGDIDLPVLFFGSVRPSFLPPRVNKVVDTQSSSNKPTQCAENFDCKIHRFPSREKCCPTSELTRRRESKHPAPHQAS